MEPCKKYVTCIMTFFIPFTSVSHCRFNSVTFPVLFTKNNNFVHVAASVYHVISKEVENHIFRHNRIFRHTCMHKQLILTKQWNYNIFVEVLHSYLRYTDRLLDVVFLLLAVILSELQTKKERSGHRKKHIEVCEGHYFFGCTSSFLCNFLLLF